MMHHKPLQYTVYLLYLHVCVYVGVIQDLLYQSITYTCAHIGTTSCYIYMYMYAGYMHVNSLLPLGVAFKLYTHSHTDSGFAKLKI